MIKIYDLLESLEHKCELAKIGNERIDPEIISQVTELIRFELEKHNNDRKIKIKCVRDLLEYCE